MGKDKGKLHGFFKLDIIRKDGSFEEGKWIPNIIVNAGLAVVSGLIGNTGSETAFTFLAVGTSATAVAVTDTLLGAEISDSGLDRVAATVSQETTTVTDDTLQLTHTFSVTGTKTVEEVGVFNIVTSNTVTMLAHALTTSKAVVNGDQLVVTYKVTLTDDGV